MTGSPITIAVTGPNKRFPLGWWATRLMLSLCGLRSIYITANNTLQNNESIAGVVIGGGDDIEPEHYGAIKAPRRNYDPERDQLEINMINHALTANIPILGICRGAQLINVVRNGTLLEDIRPMREKTPNRLYVRRIKWVDLMEGSQLEKHLGVREIKVNSLHMHAINRLGDGLNIVGKDRDGFVQAIESENQDQFLLGVQWHPEYLPYGRLHRRIFQYFSEAVKNGNSRLQLN